MHVRKVSVLSFRHGVITAPFIAKTALAGKLIPVLRVMHRITGRASLEYRRLRIKTLPTRKRKNKERKKGCSLPSKLFWLIVKIN